MAKFVRLKGGGNGKAPKSAYDLASAALARAGVRDDGDLTPGQRLDLKPSYTGLVHIEVEEGDSWEGLVALLAPRIEEARRRLKK